MEGSFSADPADKVDLLGVNECFILIGIVGITNCDSGKRRTLLSEIRDADYNVSWLFQLVNMGDTYMARVSMPEMAGTPSLAHH